jgi:hypothetical protein
MLHMCPHNAIYVSSYRYMCVRILLYACMCLCVLILLHTCPHPADPRGRLHPIRRRMVLRTKTYHRGAASPFFFSFFSFFGGGEEGAFTYVCPREEYTYYICVLILLCILSVCPHTAIYTICVCMYVHIIYIYIYIYIYILYIYIYIGGQGGH